MSRQTADQPWKIIFATTNQRKIEDLRNILKEFNLNMDILGLEDIGWDRGEIDENGDTIEENSLIKAQAVLSFCKDHNLSFPIVSDDSGVFVDILNGEPGVHTTRYADKELAANPDLPDYQCVIKLLDKMKGETNRSAKYKSCVTIMQPNGKYFQEFGVSNGTIIKKLPEKIEKSYFYCIFIQNGTKVTFNKLKGEELKHTYRYNSLRKAIRRFNNQLSKNTNSK